MGTLAIFMTTPELLDLYQKVDSFYNTSWNHLLVYSGIAFTVAVVIIPFLIQVYQRWVFKIEEKKIKDELHASLLEEERSIEKRLVEKFQKFEEIITEKVSKASKDQLGELEKAKAVIERELEGHTGNILHVQGTFAWAQKWYLLATSSFLSAACCEASSRDELNLQKSLDSLIEDCLPKIKKKDFEDEEELNNKFDSLIKELAKLDDRGRYTETIRKLKKSYEEAKKRDE